MQRIDGAAVAPSLPTPAGTNAPGYFTEGNPAGGVPATVVTADWLNMVQEELAGIVEASGATLDKDNPGQVAAVVGPVLALVAPPSGDATGDPARMKAILASDGSKAAGAGQTVAIASTSCEATAENGDGYNAATLASKACKAHGEKSAAVASYAAKITGAQSAAVAAGAGLAAEEVLVSGANSAAIACKKATAKVEVEGDCAAVIASGGVKVSGDMAAALACDRVTLDSPANRSAAIASQESTLSAPLGVLAGSFNVEYASGGGLAGGIDSGPAITPNGTDQNLTWRIDSETGNVDSDGTFGNGGADYAEFFENEAECEIPVGSLVARRGRKVRQAAAGDAAFGIVSAAPGVLGNAAPLAWAGKLERDQWGRPIVGPVQFVRWAELEGRAAFDGPVSRAPAPIPADASIYTVQARQVAAAYTPGRAYTPRADRPEHWTPIGLLGQLRARVAEGVEVDDLLVAGDDGIGVAAAKGKAKAATQRHASIEVLEILSPFDPARGYGIALCLVR